MPGSATRRASVASRSGRAPPSSESAPETCAAASAIRLLQRAPGIPSAARSSTRARARRAGAGDRRASGACGVAIGSPSAPVSRPAIVVAAFDGDLLPEDRADRHLEPVERAGDAQAGVRGDERREDAVLPEVARDHVGPRLEIEQRAHAPEQGGQGGRQALGQLQRERRAVLRARHPDPPGVRAEPHRARVRVVRHPLDAGELARAQEREHARPVVGRAVRQAQRQRQRRGRRGAVRAGAAAQPRRRHAVAAAEGVVEAAHAREAARERHLGHGQRRLGEQLLREQQTARQHELDRRDAQLLVDDAAELARARARSDRPALRGLTSHRQCRSYLARGARRPRARCAGRRRPAPGRGPARAGSAGRDGSAPARPPGRCRRSGSSRAGASAPGRSGRQ